MLKLNVLGTLSLQSDEGPVPPAAQQKRRVGLLALLAAGGDRGISRDRLQAYLWPDSSPEKSRHALDQLIYAVRRALGTNPIVAEGGDLRLDSNVISPDVAAFSVAIKARKWEEAVAIYGGPLLDGFHISESRDLDSWIDSERTRLEQQYQSALETLAKTAAANGDQAAAITWWRKLSAADPLSSRIALQVMQALTDAGESAAAVQHARSYQQLVRDELEIEPDARVAELAARLSPSAPKAVPTKHHVAASSKTAAPRADPSLPVRHHSSRWKFAAAAVGVIAVFSIFLTAQLPRARAVPPPGKIEPVNAEARELYLRGINAWTNRTKDGFDTAVVYFRRAIEIQPDYAEAYGGLANSYVLLGYSGYRPANAMFPKAKAAALRALELDSTLAAPWAALGLELTWERKFTEAEAAFRKSIAVDPAYATGHQWYGMLLKILGRIDEAVKETRIAAELDPLSPQIQNTYATFLNASGDPGAALRQYEKMIAEEPDSGWVRRNPWLLTNMAAVYAANGLMDKALDAAERSVAINPRHPRSLTALAQVHIKLGDSTRAREIFSRVDTTNEHYPAERAFFYVDLGKLDSAFTEFNRVQQWPIPIMIALGANQKLRADPRYTALLAKIGIPVPRAK